MGSFRSAERPEADWRNAAQAALKGAAFEELTSETADGLKLGPLHSRADGARAWRGEPGPWKALARVDHPSADDFQAQAREELDHGAEGLTLVFAGARAAYGFGLAGPIARALDGVDFGKGRFILEVARPADAEAFAAGVARPEDADVSFGLDPLGAVGETIGRLRARGFQGPFVAADARPVHDAGGTPAQELAFALSAGVAFLRAHGVPAALEFRLVADADVYATLAKVRAMRLLWRRVEAVCGLSPRPIRLAASSAWRMMTRSAPYVNAMRAATAAFAAGLGGADSVTLLPFTQALGLPDAFARRLARNTQLIELREARLGLVADPAAGAGGFEAMTEGLCEKAWALFQSFEAVGGLAAALDMGLVQSAVISAADALKRDVARGKSALTGVSAHPYLDADPVAVLPDAPAPLATAWLAPFRLAEPFERLRERAKGAVFLAAIGPAAAHQRRVAFARETFEAGGIATVAGTGASDAAALAEGFRASGAAAACLCGTDEAYADQGAGFAATLKNVGARTVYLAGRPGARAAADIDGYIYAGVDLVATLDEMLDKMA